MRKVILLLVSFLLCVGYIPYSHARWIRGSSWNEGDLEMMQYSIDGHPDTGIYFDPDNDNVNEIIFNPDGTITSNGHTILSDRSVDFTIQDPENLQTHGGRSTQSCIIWHNDTGKTFTITKIEGYSDVDDYTFVLFKSASATDISTGTDVQLDSVACEDNGTSVFYKVITAGFDNNTVEDGKHIIFEHSSGSAETVSVKIEGTYN